MVQGKPKFKAAGVVQTVNAKLRGHYNYYGVIGNYLSLERFYYLARRLLFKYLNRRSQRLSYNWAGFLQLMEQFGNRETTHYQTPQAFIGRRVRHQYG